MQTAILKAAIVSVVSPGVSAPNQGGRGQRLMCYRYRKLGASRSQQHPESLPPWEAQRHIMRFGNMIVAQRHLQSQDQNHWPQNTGQCIHERLGLIEKIGVTSYSVMVISGGILWFRGVLQNDRAHWAREPRSNGLGLYHELREGFLV